jgi:hypothetical protein
MTTEKRTEGECGSCERAVTLIEHSEYPTCRRDGNRYAYPERQDGWCIFRCEDCHAVIEDVWRPKTAALAI